jgi:hypothetical protein
MAHTTLPFEQWTALAREKRAEAVPVARDVAAEPTLTNGRLSDVVMSTSSEDRARDTISVTGWNLARFLSNPLLLWCHDNRLPPIGQVRGVEVAGEKLLGKEIVFLDESLASSMPGMDDDHLAFAMMIGRMYTHAARWLRAFSVGLIPEEWSWNEERGGVDFKRQELLELSACDIPMNPDCLSGAKSAGIELAPLLVRAEKKLDADTLAPGWLSTRQASAIYRTLSAPRVQVPTATPATSSLEGVVAGLARQVEALTLKVSSMPSAPAPAPAPAPEVKSTVPVLTHQQLAQVAAKVLGEELFSITGRLPD